MLILMIVATIAVRSGVKRTYNIGNDAYVLASTTVDGADN